MKMADTSSVCSDLDSGIGSCSPTSTGPNTAYIPEHKSMQTFRNTEDYLYAMKEDLAEWLNCLYNLEITVDTFFDSLDTGVLLCEHAVHVQELAEEYRDESGEEAMERMYDDFGQGGLISRHSDLRKQMKIPDKGPVFKRTAKSGTFLARDNIANYIAWCRALGIPDVLLFETEDLVSRKNDKSVVLCLLEVARQGSKFGMLVPCLIQLEQEIDAEIRGEPPPPPPPQMKPKEPEVFVQQKTCDMRSLDEMVRDLVSQCTCHIQFPVVRLGEGKYMVGEQRTLIFVRILRNHVMVRVGGGWDTLEHYLNKHDPCRECKSQRILGKSSTTPLAKRRGSAPPQSLSVFKPKESQRQPEVSTSSTCKLNHSTEDILSDDSSESTQSSRSGTLKRGDGAQATRSSSFRRPSTSKSSDQLCNGRLTPTPSSGIPQRSSRDSSVPSAPTARRRLSMDNVAKSTPGSIRSADSSPAMTRKQRSGSATRDLSENYNNLHNKSDHLQRQIRDLNRTEPRERRGSTPTSKSLDFSKYQNRRGSLPCPETPKLQRKFTSDLSSRNQRRPTTPTSDMYRRERSGSETPRAERKISAPAQGVERRATTPQPQRRKLSEPSPYHRRAATSQPGTPLTNRRAKPMSSDVKRGCMTPSPSQESKLSRSGSLRTGKELRNDGAMNSLPRTPRRRSETPEPQPSRVKQRSGSLNNLDSAKLSVNYDEIEDIGGNEQLYLEMEKLFMEYKEQEQAKSAVEDELDRRIREKIKPDVERYKEKQAQKVKDDDKKRERTTSLNQPISIVKPKSSVIAADNHRRSRTNSLNENTEPKNAWASSSTVDSRYQATNDSKVTKSASKPLEPRTNGSSPTTAVVPPFSYSKTSEKETECEDDLKKPRPVEEEGKTPMEKSRNEVELELEERLRAKIQESRKTPERDGRAKMPMKTAQSQRAARSKTPDPIARQRRCTTPDPFTRSRTTQPDRTRRQVRSKTPEPGAARRRLNSTGSGDSSDFRSSDADSNANFYGSLDSLSVFSSSSSETYRDNMAQLAKPRKDEKGGAPTRIPGPRSMRRSSTCADFCRSSSQMSLASSTDSNSLDDSQSIDNEVRSITRNAEPYRKRRPSAPDVLRLRMQSPLITGRSTILNKQLSTSPAKESKPDGVKAMTAFHFV